MLLLLLGSDVMLIMSVLNISVIHYLTFPRDQNILQVLIYKQYFVHGL